MERVGRVGWGMVSAAFLVGGALGATVALLAVRGSIQRTRGDGIDGRDSARAASPVDSARLNGAGLRPAPRCPPAIAPVAGGEVAELREELAAVESRLDREDPVCRTLEWPENLAAEFQALAFESNVRQAAGEAGVAMDDLEIDCSEYPCLAIAHETPESTLNEALQKKYDGAEVLSRAHVSGGPNGTARVRIMGYAPAGTLDFDARERINARVMRYVRETQLEVGPSD